MKIKHKRDYSVSHIYTNAFLQLYIFDNKKKNRRRKQHLYRRTCEDDTKNKTCKSCIFYYYYCLEIKERQIDRSLTFSLRFGWPFWIPSDQAQTWKQKRICKSRRKKNLLDKINQITRLHRCDALRFLDNEYVERKELRSPPHCTVVYVWSFQENYPIVRGSEEMRKSKEISRARVCKPRAISLCLSASLKIQGAYRAGLGNAMRV